MKLSILFIVIFNSFLLLAQSKSGLVVDYLEVVNDSKDNWGLVDVNEGRLVIKDSSMSHYFTKRKDTIIAASTGELIELSASDSYYHQYIKNPLESIVNFSVGNDSPFVVVDTLLFKYTFGSVKSIINGVECHQAFLNFRGRDYELFYAPSIPYSDGPFKFLGLPGLIMSVKSFDETVHIIVKKIHSDFPNDALHYREILNNDKTSWSYKEYVDAYLETLRLQATKIEQQYSSIGVEITNYYPKRLIEIYEN